MPYRIAGIDVHKKKLAVVVADVEAEEEYQFIGDFCMAGSLKWLDTNGQNQSTWADLQEATEYGAYGVAIVVALALTELPKMERSAKGTGIDYWVGDSKDPRRHFPARRSVRGVWHSEGRQNEDRSSVDREVSSGQALGEVRPACLCCNRGILRSGDEVRKVNDGDQW